jgi:hypothetical protein
MTPAQGEVVHQSIRVSQVEVPINELFQPFFDASPFCPHRNSAYLRKRAKSGETQSYRSHHCGKTFNIKTNTPLARLRKCHLLEEYARKNCDHKRLINLKNRVIDNINHIKTGNGSITHFKSWIMGNMKGIATQYLPNYLAWFRKSHTQYDYQQTLAAAYN